MGCSSSAAAAAAEHEPRADFERSYALGKRIGGGSFGAVFSTRDIASGQVDAVKIIDTVDGVDSDDRRVASFHRKLARSEVATWRAVGRHPNVVELHRVFADKSRWLMVMERCKCTVADRCRSDASLAPGAGSTPRLMLEMLLGIQACHVAAVVHRDVKQDNFLIAMDGTVKLCDFGLAALLPAKGGGLTGECGTACFMSPEMLHGRMYGKGTDMWSFGAMAYAMMFGELPYIPQRQTPKEMKKAIKAGEVQPRWLQEDMRHKSGATRAEFLQRLLQRDPSQRCAVGDALEHRYLEGHSPREQALAATLSQKKVVGPTSSLGSKVSSKQSIASKSTALGAPRSDCSSGYYS